MSYDIYGEHLTRGHCEVHPWVDCEYPCPTCMAERAEDQRSRDEQQALDRAYEDYYNREMNIAYHESLMAEGALEGLA